MINVKRKKVLFLCHSNSATSQIAAALLKDKAEEKFEVFSAGTNPSDIDIRAVDVLRQFGLKANNLVCQNIETFKTKTFDYVITLCEKTTSECRNFPNTAQQFSWDLPEPKARLGNNPFVNTLIELNSRLSMFISIEQQSAKPDSGVEITLKEENKEQLFAFDPVCFYKSLTDDIRLKTLMLTHYHGELCVCELMAALAEESQPKVSRNLAVLKKSNIIIARKHGQWVFYRINPALPQWAKLVIAHTTESNVAMIYQALQRLSSMKGRPNKASFCK